MRPRKTPALLAAWALAFGNGAWGAEDLRGRWGIEADLSGAVGLLTETVRNDGRTGAAPGVLVRFGDNGDWETGFGYNVISLHEGIRLRPATLVGTRRFPKRGAWTPYVRLGGGISSDQSAGAMNRMAFRAGAGAERFLNRRWAVGAKTECWVSPRSGGVGEDMVLLTAGLTLALAFERENDARVEPDAQKEETKPTGPVPETIAPAPIAATEKEKRPPETQVYFRSEKWKPSSTQTERNSADWEGAALFLARHPEARVEVHGHADARGPQEFNRALSQRRAEAVRDLLANRWGLEPERISVYAHGSSQPVADNDTPEGRARNRRAVVVFRLPDE
ncbi:MAG: OmpA family protein [Elusimicrobia bacterium]|nr:OmpA family protein [Elusimicrobiota bacterium]